MSLCEHHLKKAEKESIELNKEVMDVYKRMSKEIVEARKDMDERFKKLRSKLGR